MTLRGKEEMLRLAVIGGGISGVSTAFFLQQHFEQRNVPFKITVYEKSTRIGGAVYTENVEDCLYEGGVDAFLSEDRDILKLCRDLSIQDDILNSDEARRQTLVFWEGQLRRMPKGFMMSIPTSFWPFLTDTLISWPGKIRMGMDFFIPQKTDNKDESFADFIRRRLGQEAFDKIAEPLVSGITGADVETMSIASTFPLYPDLEKEYGSLIKGLYQKRKKFLKAVPKASRSKYSFFLSFKAGMNQIVDKMVDRVGSHAFEHTGVKAITRKTDNLESPGYHILTENDTKADADLVVLATPAYVSSKIVTTLDPTLATRLATIPYNSAVIINYTFKASDLDKKLEGFGFVVPKKENRSIKAGSWASLKFPGRCPEGSTVVRASIAGNRVEACIAGDDARINAWVREDLRIIAGIHAKPLFYRVYRWPKSRPQYTLGHSQRVVAILETLSKHENLYLTGSAYSGASVARCLCQSRALAQTIMDEVCPGRQTGKEAAGGKG
jgi:oxygen-dependent protoporphyrinogen oxidase